MGKHSKKTAIVSSPDDSDRAPSEQLSLVSPDIPDSPKNKMKKKKKKKKAEQPLDIETDSADSARPTPISKTTPMNIGGDFASGEETPDEDVCELKKKKKKKKKKKTKSKRSVFT